MNKNSFKPTLSNIFTKPKSAVTDDEDPRLKRKVTSAMKWTDALYVVPSGSARRSRRIQRADARRNTKKHNRQQRQTYFKGKAYGEIAAVRVLRELEDRFDLGEGGLRQRLIDDGALSDTKSRIVGWEVFDHPEVGEVTEPITTSRSVGHTPAEILAGAGFGRDAVVEIYGAVEGGQPFAAKGAADLALSNLAQRVAA